MKEKIKFLKAFTIFGLACCFITNNYAASCNDTTQRKKPYKISQKEFLCRYGKDDTARAIINHYFKQRKYASRGLVFNSSIAAVSGVLLLIIGGNIIGFFIALVAIAALWGTIISIALVIYMWLHFSRKRLWDDLNKYLSGGGVSKKLLKKLRADSSHKIFHW